MISKRRIRPFVPPILLSALSRTRRWRGPRRERTARTLSDMIGGSAFSVGFRKVSLPAGTFFVPAYAEDRPAARAVLSGVLHEPATHALVGALLRRRGGSLVHAGTFFGDMLPTFSAACAGTVYAFEPVLENYVLAKLCVAENELRNVLLLNAALGSDVAIARIDTGDVTGPHRGGASQIGATGQLTAIVTVDSLRPRDVSVIQLDVEGSELAALEGARATIEADSPVILIEDNRKTCAGFLTSLGYGLAGRIPGLAVWARARDREEVDALLPRATAQPPSAGVIR